MCLYDILILGDVGSGTADRLEAALRSLIEESGIDEADISYRRTGRGYQTEWDGRRPTVVASFSSISGEDLALVQFLSTKRIPIIPIAGPKERFESFPEALQSLNGTTVKDNDPNLMIVAATVLEAVGLLREQRRIFISYRRVDSRDVAVQLHNSLSARGFNVFLDTHAIRPGKVFQEELWQQLCDSDVVLLLDTPGYFDSKWTREEFGRAQSFGIYIYRLVWPDHHPQGETSLSETRRLRDSDLIDGLLLSQTLDEIVERLEWLRARGVADRHLSLSGKLQAEVEGVGGRVVGAGAYRALSIQMDDGFTAWVYPVVGVPTAPLMNAIARRAGAADHEGPFLVYDHQGIAEPWLEHLDWLNTHIPEVDFMRVLTAGDTLRARRDAS